MAGLGVAGRIAGTDTRFPPQGALIVWADRGVFVVLLALVILLLRVEYPMRSSLRIRVQFEPSRLSMGYLRSAYELTAPVVRRVVKDVNIVRVNELGRAVHVRSCTRMRTSK